MDDSEYLVLRTDISHIVDAELKKFIERHSDDDKFLYEIRQYIDSVKASDYTWNIEKIKIVLSVLQGVKTEPCKCVWPKKKVARIKVQLKRATLRSDPTQTVRYTAENGGSNAAVFRVQPASLSG